MSIDLYDSALVKKIKSWVKEENLRVLSPEESSELFRQRADMTNDKPLSLPLFALSRDPQVELIDPHKNPMSYDGMMLDATKDKTLQIDAIPISLTYQLDIYTRKSKQGCEYLRNFVFNFINFPKIEVVLPYNGRDYIHNSYIRLIPTVEDTSDIPQHLVGDQFTRWTIRFTIDDAKLFSLPYKDNVHIVGYEVEVKEDF